jgi:hypothetical protein
MNAADGNLTGMRIPDFFIIGAPKCGTTALTEYLSEHPAICFARTKETHFFADDFKRKDDNFAGYWRRNFSYFDPRRHRAIGEASGTYYISDVAVENILKQNPAAKFIYMVRDPVEMIHSLYYELRFGNSENTSLEEGWDLQAARAQGRNIPPQCIEPTFLQYRAMGSLGRRLEALKKRILPGQLFVVVLDDLIVGPKKVYEDVLSFIGVPSDGREVFPQVNSNKVQRSRLLGYLTASLPLWLHKGVREFKHLAGLSHVPLNFLVRLNAKPARRPPLAEDFRKRLTREFEPEVRLLERQLGRDLSHWRA